MNETLYTLKIINFNDIFPEIFSAFLDDAHKYTHKKLLEKKKINFRKSIEKKLLYNRVLTDCINLLNSIKKEKIVLVVQPYVLLHNLTLDYTTYCDVDRMKTEILLCLNKLKKTFPNNLVILKQSIDLTDTNSINFIESKIKNFNPISYQEIRLFSQENELTHLSVLLESPGFKNVN